jgi:hypothetical protein
MKKVSYPLTDINSIINNLNDPKSWSVTNIAEIINFLSKGGQIIEEVPEAKKTEVAEEPKKTKAKKNGIS